MVSGWACPQLPPSHLQLLCHLPGLWASLGFFHPCKIQVKKLKVIKLKSWEPADRRDKGPGSLARGSAPHRVALSFSSSHPGLSKALPTLAPEPSAV